MRTGYFYSYTEGIAAYVLSITGHIQVGDYVLIHAGSSGVGTAAIQLARKAGAIPLVTAGSPHKLQMAENLGAVAGFNYREDFSEATLRFTKGNSLSRHKKKKWLNETFISMVAERTVAALDKLVYSGV